MNREAYKRALELDLKMTELTNERKRLQELLTNSTEQFTEVADKFGNKIDISKYVNNEYVIREAISNIYAQIEKLDKEFNSL